MRNKFTRIAGFFPLLCAFAVTAATAWEVGRRPTPADAEPFHAAAAAAIRALPEKFGAWEGVDVEVPASAVALLKPNALRCRVFRNKETGAQASVLLVQCRDTRDMAGHYPPICYPSQGWLQDGPGEQVSIPLARRSLNAMRYEFHKSGFDREHRLAVYDFFAIPGRGLPIDMPAVRKAAADYTARPFGAAQVQVVFEGHRSLETEQTTAAELLRSIEPVIDLLSDGKWNTR